MIKVTLWIVFLMVASYAGFCLLLYLKQRSILYYPVAEVHTENAKAEYLVNQGETLKVWQIAGRGDKALIYFGGNAEDVSVNALSFKKLFKEYTIFLVNYRGYGGSTGSPTEEALFSDALFIYEHVRKQYQLISLMGRSLGSGVAAYVASRKKIENLILVTPYDSMVNVATSYYPFIPVSFLMKDRYDTLSLVNNITAKTLVLIAEKDEVIPRKNSEQLVAGLAQKKTHSLVISGAGHNNISMFPEYNEAIRLFSGE